MRLHQTKNFLHRKGIHQQNKMATYRIEKKFANHVTDKGLICKIYKEITKLNNRIQIIQLKNEQWI